MATRPRATAIAAVTLVIVTAWFIWSGTLGYFWALHLESRWVPAAPRSRADLERHLFLYSTRIIEPRESAWGRGYQLKPNEFMLQYRLLWSAPLDVVYDDGGMIQAIYTSYE